MVQGLEWKPWRFAVYRRNTPNSKRSVVDLHASPHCYSSFFFSQTTSDFLSQTTLEYDLVSRRFKIRTLPYLLYHNLALVWQSPLPAPIHTPIPYPAAMSTSARRRLMRDFKVRTSRRAQNLWSLLSFNKLMCTTRMMIVLSRRLNFFPTPSRSRELISSMRTAYANRSSCRCLGLSGS